MNKTIKNALILTAITMVAGFCLGIVYEVTKAPIATAQENAKQEAYKAVLADAEEFSAYEAFDADDAASILKDAGLTSDIIDEVAEAKDGSGETVGYVITVTSKEGYGGDIKISTGIDMTGTVKGVSILSISETAGLGMKAAEQTFQDQFKDKQVEQFAYTKTGATEDGQIDALSGATITTNAFTNDVNAALAYYQAVLAEGGSN
ncbi:RnfABCDGE type electron transport complex subunit G [Hespellia stercorisuis]|uniref:Ion-translocating oxidoreductase complex subunit G n=1 Tax=Hespellia stercorisuis DSM 15480 TaxID=1121950 RepID=A0A1M6HHV6_9FIRM|nr:RnfABCDGE type electron transport complex subunit G [Hespellia stercorisuis]SHJ21800.1 electron transport complex protein RnfG [Hespellia stercorisuis DSM 15480]